MKTVKIEDGWAFTDPVTGLTLTIVKGKNLDRLKVAGVPGCGPRDFFFTHDGKFDGTGSAVGEVPTPPKPAATGAPASRPR